MERVEVVTEKERRAAKAISWNGPPIGSFVLQYLLAYLILSRCLLLGLHNQSVPSQKIIHHAKETLEYLKARENFWRQQQPSHIMYPKEKIRFKMVRQQWFKSVPTLFKLTMLISFELKRVDGAFHRLKRILHRLMNRQPIEINKQRRTVAVVDLSRILLKNRRLKELPVRH